MEPDKQEPIAIIGAACRLPGEVSSLGSLWDMISNARTGHCKVPPERWDGDTWHHPDPDRKGSIAVKHGYFLQQDVSHFDAPFFSTTAKEAAGMDPMKRLLLEVSYESIENAGIPVDTLMNSDTGCYVGCMTNDYEMSSLRDIQDVAHAAASATSEAMTANRVSWFFGLKGPSLTLDTACSSSLYALHLACQSLRLGETNASLVCGVNLILVPNTMHQLSAMHMLSPEGISHTFDDRANGYGRGEGIGSLVVKRLSDALRDGDTIRAVIRATGANADGKTPSITQPSSRAQAELIRKTYEAAGLAMTSTQYFESHGTGTPVGDPIELEAIASTLGASRKAEGLSPLYVGSIKPNVGHTEGCSGLAGVFKAVACLEKGMLAPTHGVGRLNPKLKLSEWNIVLPDRTMKWPTSGQRRVSINSFGFGGANAHAILDDAYNYMTERGIVGNHNTVINPVDGEGEDSGSDSGVSVSPGGQTDKARRLFVFSSKDQGGIPRIASSYADALGKTTADTASNFGNLAYTLSERRSHFDFRSFAVASTMTELRAQLSKGLPKLKRASRQDGSLAFIFTGQGAQWPAMGRELVCEPIFEESMRSSQEYLKQLGCMWDAFEELSKTDDSNINLPEYSQTLCTVLQVALVDLLRSWNILPKATVGHSSGEIAAAYAAFNITHADAIKIAYVRGLSSATVTRNGAMLAAGLSREEAQAYLANVPASTAVVACVNSPTSVTLSGDVSSIDILEKIISADGKFARKLKVKTAYHSHHMRDVADGYLEQIGHVNTQKGSTETIMFSSLTGKQVKPEELDAKYWVSNMCAPVEFSAALTALLGHTVETKTVTGRIKKTPIRWTGLVEVGPHSALQGPAGQIITASDSKAAKEAPYSAVVLRGKDASETALTLAGKLWALGHSVDLVTANGPSTSPVSGPKNLVDLPPYPWNHSRGYWHEAFSTKSNRFPSAPRTDLLGIPVDMQNAMEPQWRNFLRTAENPWIEDHKITGTTLYPGAGMLIMALEGALQTADPGRKVSGFRFTDVTFERGLVVNSGDDSNAVETRLSFVPDKSIAGRFGYTLYSTTTGTSWTRHCAGTIALEYSTAASSVEDACIAASTWARQTATYAQLKAFSTTTTTSSSSNEVTTMTIDVDSFYDQLTSIGMDYGPLFRNVVALTAIPTLHASFGKVIIPDTQSSMPYSHEYPHIMHPATMDAIFHLLLSAFTDGNPPDEAAVPYSIAEMYVAAEQPHGAGTCFQGYGQLLGKSEGGREIAGDLVVSDEEWSAPKLVVKGFALRQVTAGAEDGKGVGIGEGEKKCARVEWKEDVEFIRTGEDLVNLEGGEANNKLSLWMDRLTHKTVLGDVLVVVDGEVDGVAEVLRDVWARIGRRPGCEKVTATATSEVGLETLRSALPLYSKSSFELWDTETQNPPTPESGAYDLALILGGRTQAKPLAKVQKLVSSDGYLVLARPADASQDAVLESAIVINDEHTHLHIIPPTRSDASMPSEVHILIPTSPSPQVTSFSATLTSLLQSPNLTVHTTTFPSGLATTNLTGAHVISLLESETPLIHSWTAPEFDGFKSLVSSAVHIFWLTRGTLLESWSSGVEFALAQGLLRVLRNEYTLTTLPHFDISSSMDITSEAGAQLVLDVWKKTLVEGAEMEYAELEGRIHVPRAVDEPDFDEELQRASGNAEPVPSSARGKVLKPDTLTETGEFLWVEDIEAAKALAPTEVEVEVEFVGLSATGDDSRAQLPSNEAVGLITRCGENVKSLVVGQRVVLFSEKSCRTHVHVDAELVAPIPESISAQDVAAMPASFIAAQYALLEVAQMHKGQRVLIHSAASALGQASLQIAQFVGAETFALVASKAEKDVLMTRYSFPSSRIFDSTLTTFADAISQATGGSGVDVVLLGTQPNPAILPPLAASLADFGTFIDLSASPSITLPQSKHNASLIRINMSHVTTTRSDLIKTLFQRTFSVFTRSGTITPITPTTVIPITTAHAALTQANTPAQQTHGKIVLSLFSPSATILTLPPPAPKLALDPKGTYVLAGGLGALGLDLATMMISHGAKHIVFLTRSLSPSKRASLTHFQSLGASPEGLICDVTSSTSVSTVFSRLRAQGRIIKGVIQCAMVLQDGIFANMTHAQWQGAVLPKTLGSKNLLDELSLSNAQENDPFFVLLSSITGVIGNTAQANYASGNTFEDALAHYARTPAVGINRATSVDVGLVGDSSHFDGSGEFGDLDSYLLKYQHGWKGLRTSLDELSVALGALMRGATASGRSGEGVMPAQMVLGLGDQLVRADGGGGFQADKKFRHRVARGSGGDEDGAGKGAGKGVSVGEMLSKAATLADAAVVVEESFKGQIAAAIGVEVEEVDLQKPLPEFGVDSLKAVEIRNRTLREMQSDISVFELLSATPVTDLAVKIAQRSGFVKLSAEKEDF